MAGLLAIFAGFAPIITFAVGYALGRRHNRR